ncbi:MAG: hypothetical protein H0W18_12170 [Acidobacteria bacterium]|nr:hypothetical protein [Acidobacteriota bacterium]
MTPEPSTELAEQIAADWKAITQIMTLAGEDDFEAELPEDLEIKQVDAAPRAMTLFRFPDVIYALEPSRGCAVAIRSDGDSVQMRAFARDGTEIDNVDVPLGDPAMN